MMDEHRRGTLLEADVWRVMQFAFLLTVSMLALTACSSTGLVAPTLMATMAPLPTPTITPLVVPTHTVYEDRNIPACDGFQVLPEPIQFTWPGADDAADAGEWGYFRCGKNVAETAAFYRERMTKPPYLWQEFNWVELPEGTLGVYFHTVYQRWFYIWVLPIPGDQKSNVVLAQRDLGTPLVMPCCH